MPTHELPGNPDLRHLKGQAKDLLRSGAAPTLAKAQFEIARQYGFPSWTNLKLHVESLHEVGQLKEAIDTNHLERVKEMMTRNPELHQAPLGYANDGTLTWVAECRVPYEAPSATRLAMAQWMIDNGSDVNQGSGGPLGRAALNQDRIPMMELLVRNGARPNHSPVTALDYLLGAYTRDTEAFRECVEILLRAGGTTRYDAPGVLDVLRATGNRWHCSCVRSVRLCPAVFRHCSSE